MYATSQQRDDGFGAQFQNILWDILYSENNHLKYIFSAMNNIEHNYNDDPNYTNTLINYMNLDPNYTFISPNKIPNIYTLKRDLIYDEIENNIDLYHSGKVFEAFQSQFFSDKINPYDTESIHVAIHVRRGNKVDINESERTTVPDEFHLQVIQRIRDDNPGNKLIFHIFSQGDKSNFTSYINHDTILHLNEDVLTTFTGMVFANILATTTSSFSYLAALLSKGTIYYKPFWHKPLRKWIIL
jgi:hypothetical protein